MQLIALLILAACAGWLWTKIPHRRHETGCVSEAWRVRQYALDHDWQRGLRD